MLIVCYSFWESARLSRREAGGFSKMRINAYTKAVFAGFAGFMLCMSTNGQMSPAAAQAAFDRADKAMDRNDYATVLKELMPLAKQGEARAQSGLALLYYEGDGVPKNFKEEAARWNRLAADQGFAYFLSISSDSCTSMDLGVSEGHKGSVQAVSFGGGSGLRNSPVGPRHVVCRRGRCSAR